MLGFNSCCPMVKKDNPYGCWSRKTENNTVVVRLISMRRQLQLTNNSHYLLDKMSFTSPYSSLLDIIIAKLCVRQSIEPWKLHSFQHCRERENKNVSNENFVSKFLAKVYVFFMLYVYRLGE